MRWLDANRLHAQHGPIDLIISADDVDVAAITGRVFPEILPDLVTELFKLRQAGGGRFRGPVAQRMATAVAPFVPAFITPMAAVAGSVADHVLSHLVQSGSPRAWVNNGGDIAVHLTGGHTFTVGICTDPDRRSHQATLRLTPEDNIGGIATSGWRGRSQSLGIADAVTVLAGNAAVADAAATMIANRVDLPDHPGIIRAPATDLLPDSDLGRTPVTTAVPTLSGPDVAMAMTSGLHYAQTLIAKGVIVAAYLDLQGQFEVVSDTGAPKLQRT